MHRYVSRIWRACLALIVALGAAPIAFAQGADGGTISSFPITGAYSASFVEDRNDVSIIQLAGNYDKSLSTGAFNAEPRSAIAREFFRTHPDQYDYLVVFSTFEFNTGPALAFEFTVRNDTQGIGQQQTDLTSLFGSHSKLQAYIDMAALTRYTTDPTDPNFELVLQTLAHEMLHRWAAFVHFKQADGTLSDALIGQQGAHWSYLLDTNASVQYGADWKDNGDGTFSAVGIRKFYSPLDLYLAGFYKPEEVPPFFLINNPAIDKTQLPQDNVTVSGTKQVISVNDIIAAEGPRIPAADQSQKEFRLAFILLTGSGTPVSDAQVTAVNNIRNAFMTRFSILTGGRGVAHVYPEAMPTATEGAPTQVSGGTIRTTPSSLDDATAWLRSRQTPDGFWSDKDTTTVRDTTVAASVLGSLDQAFTGGSAAVQWLNAHPSANVDYLARQSKLITDLHGDATALRTQLLTLQNADGGWGVGAGYQSDPLDTGLAILALSGSAAGQAAAVQAGQYLLANQNSDGGWSPAAGAPSRTTVTTIVLQALNAIGKQGTVATTALNWLKGKQNSDGGFGDSPSTVHDTANVLQTLMLLDSVAQIRPSDATNFILSRQTTTGSWEGSVYSTAEALAALRRFSFPNLVLSNFTAAPTAPHDGDRVQFTIVVNNNGNVASQPSVVRLYDGDPAAGGKAVGNDLAIPVLGPGIGVTLTPLWDSLNSAGTHTFFAVADPDNVQAETSKKDNSASVTVTVQPAPANVQLTFGVPDISISPAQPNRLPTALAISLNVRNLGLADAHGVPVFLWVGPAGSGTLVGQTTVDVLARSTVVVNFSYVLTQPGTTTFTAQIDPNNLFPTSQKSDSTASYALTPTPSVDLAVTTSDITIDKTPAVTGDDATFTVHLHNQGTTDAPSAVVRYGVTDGTTTEALPATTVQMNAGQSATQTIPWRVDLSGQLTFTVQLDPDGLIPDLDRTNNIATFAFPAGTPTGINLAVSFKDFTATPNPGLEGYPLTLAAIVRNTGTVAASNVEVAFYNGDPSAGGVQIGATQVLASIAPGGSTTATLTWSAVPDSNDKLLYVVVDPANKIAEFSKTDNSAFNVVPILSLPDLAIASGDISLSPAFPKTGQSVNILAHVSNLGAQGATNVLVRAYDGDPNAGGVQIGTDQVIASISGFGTAVVSIPWSAGNAVARHSIFVWVDPLQAVLERNRANNIAEHDFAVQNGDLYVSQRYFSPNGDGVQDTTQLFFRLQTATTVSVNVVNSRQQVIRQFTNPAWVNSTGGDVVWDGLDGVGRLVQDGTYVLRVVDGAGNNLGETPVDVDTNRSSLLTAVDTQFASYTNLTCALPATTDLFFSSDDSTAFFNISSGHSPQAVYPLGVYSMAGDGTDIRTLAPESLFTGFSFPVNVPSPAANGSRTVFVRINPNSGVGELWSVDADGKNLKQLPLPGSQYGWMSPNGKIAYGVTGDNTSIQFAFVDTATSPAILFSVPNNGFISGQPVPSPDGSKIALTAFDNARDSYMLWVVDSTTGAGTELQAVANPAAFYWAPSSTLLAVPDVPNNRIVVLGTDGSVLKTYTAPIIPGPREQISIDNVTWASSSTEFAFTLSHTANNEGGCGGYGYGYGGYGCPSISASAVVGSGPIANPGGAYVADLVTGTISAAALYVDQTATTTDPNALAVGGTLTWVPGERSLIYSLAPAGSNAQATAILLDSNNQQKAIFTAWANIDFGLDHFTPTGRELLFFSNKQTIDPTSICYQQGYTDIWSFRSLLNLTADLRAIRSQTAGGIQLSGTASDLNFSSYVLEYALSTNPNQWQPIIPAVSQPVVDDFFTTWVPPAPGNYFVRLTVTDLAGNSRQTIKSVSWTETASITDVYLTPPIISPNGDGVNDTASIHYRVMEPVHLSFNFYNAAGVRVRTIVRDESTIGEEVTFPWDGRDDNGLTVPDGKYSMTVLDYEFFVNVDATPPVVQADIRPAYEPGGAPGARRNVLVDPGLEWLATDLHLDGTATVESGVGDNPTEWDPASFTLCQGTPLFPDRTCGAPPTLDQFVNRRFRVTAADTAGNKTVVITPVTPEELIVSEFGNYTIHGGCQAVSTTNATDCNRAAYDPIGKVAYNAMTDSSGGSDSYATLVLLQKLRFSVSSTLRRPIAQLFVQYHRQGDSNPNWTEVPLTEYFTSLGLYPDGTELLQRAPGITAGTSLHPAWDITGAGLQGGQLYALRLHAVDAAGNSYLSNSFKLSSQSFTFEGLYQPPPRIADIEQLIPPGHPTPTEWVIWGQQFLPQALASVKLFVTSDQDPRYAQARLVGELAYPGQALVYVAADLKSCTRYSGYLVGETEPQIDPVTGATTTITYTSNSGDMSTPCLLVGATAEPVPAPDCDTPSKNQIVIHLGVTSVDGQQLKLLTVSTPLPDGSGDNVLFNVNQPQSGTQYDFVLDTSQIPDAAPYPLTARLVNVSDQKAETPIKVVIDHTPPVARITYPADGQEVCAVPFVSQGQNHSALTVQAQLTDQGGMYYSVDAASGGQPASVWNVIHNSADGSKGNYPSLPDPVALNSLVFPPRYNSGQVPYTEHDDSGAVANLYDPDGTVTIRLRTRDWGGFEHCDIKTFVVHGQVKNPRASLDPALPTSTFIQVFSPNGDGVFDSATVNYGADEPFIADINVFPATAQLDGSIVVATNSVRALASGQQNLAGDTSVVWDGTDGSGAVVPDGLYAVVVSIKDGCGNIRSFTLPITVDTTAPAITIAYPSTTDALPTIVQIQGTVTDLHLTGYGVDYGVGSSPTAWVRVGSGTAPVASTTVLGTWNTFALDPGSYAVRIVASDIVGNQSSVVVPVTLAVRANLIGDLEAVPTLFSLNGDGKHATAIHYELEQDGVVTLTLLDHTGTVRRTLSKTLSVPKGPVNVTWDGRDDQSLTLPDDTYTVDLQVTAAANALQREEEKITVALDSTAPLLDVTRPANGFVTAVGGIVGSINDAHLDQFTVSTTNTPSAPVWQVVDTETQNRANAVLTSLQGLPDGDYAVKLDATDLAQNHSTKVVPFTIDSTPPKVSLTAPVAGAVLGVVHSPFNLTGTIDEAHLDTYRLHLNSGTTPTPGIGTDLITGTTLPLPSVLTAWDVSKLQDGLYTLQLLAQDKAGNSGQATATVIVDNTPPTAAITQPVDFGYITKPLDIRGSANDANFSDYKVEVAPGDKGSSTRWSELGDSTTAVSGGVLVSLQALPPEGVQTLRLTVHDKADNITQVLVQVTVDTIPPAAPINLAATVESAHNAHLTWTPNTEPDLAGYLVFRDGVKITAALVTTASYIDVGLPDGRYTYVVKAYDKAGNESQPSNSLTVAIDTTPPTTHLSAPLNGTLVAGLVDVKGTAYSADDFKEYRLWVGTGPAPTDFQLLRRSPVPVLADLLGQWNTFGLVDDSQYTIKLEGEDINGNVGTDLATVTVHNKPPVPPTNLKAVATGANVQLTWSPDTTDQYLVGYLLYRNDHLANQTGVLVGSLQPYAIVGTSYPDLNLPNGTYTYYLLSIDKAGNTSSPSNSVQVVIHTHPPHATITQPATNTNFEKGLYVLATDPDLDVASVQFQYRAVGAAAWTNLASPVTALPYGVTFDAAALGLPYGNYQLQAISTDSSGSTDPAPTPITVTYKKLTPPAATVGVTSHVQGGAVTLSWTANTESDLAGYFVERTDASNTTTRLNSTAITTTTYVDSNVSDGSYQYRIVAVDTSANEAAKSQPAAALVYTPVVTQPYTPTTVSTVSLTGTGQPNTTLSGTLTNSTGSASLPSITTTTAGAFTVPNLPLALGTNTVALRLTDTVGNVSKDANIPVTVGTVPSKPTGLAATATGYQVSLAWNKNPEADLSGYHLFRNGQLVLPDLPMTDLTATASSQLDSMHAPGNVLDNDLATSWAPQANTAADVTGQWLAVSWPQLRDVTHIDIRWNSVEQRAVDFDIQALSGTVWVPVAQIRGNTVATSAIDLSQPYRTTQLRVVILATDLSVIPSPLLEISEIGALYRQFITTNSFTDTAPDGMQTYTVTAINNYAFESVASDPTKLPVGDVTPPDPVTLTATVAQSDVTLTWTASVAPDVDHYLIYRNGTLISTWTDLSNLKFIDPALTNGTYDYTVVAVDHANNQSVPSNDAKVTVAIVPPSPPLSLTLSVVPTGNALDLSWGAAAGTPPDHYEIFRGTAPGQEFTLLPQQPTGTTLRDKGLVNGTRYYYVVNAVDTLGNPSSNSNEVSGVPADTVPPRVGIHYPTRPGVLYPTSIPNVLLFARTEAGATVTLSNNGAQGVSTTALAASTTVSASVNTSNDVVLSPSGRFGVYPTPNQQIRLFDADSGTDVPIVTLTSFDDSWPGWTPDGSEVVYVERDPNTLNHYVRAYRIADGNIRNLTAPTDGNFSFASLSPNGKTLFVVDQLAQQWWLIDTNSGAYTAVTYDNCVGFYSLQWSPDSSRFAYVTGCPSEAIVAVHAATANVTVVASSGVLGDSPTWSPDGSALAYDALDAANNSQIMKFSFADGTTTAVTLDPIDHYAPFWSPDGASIAYQLDDNSVELLDLTYGSTLELDVPVGYISFWPLSGYIAAWSPDYSTWMRIAPAGRVEFKGVPLTVGDNLFTMQGTDTSGNVGVSSAAVDINYSTASLPDLAISTGDLVALPTAVRLGEAVRVTLTVHNIGNAGSPAAGLSVLAVDATGAATTLLSGTVVPALLPGISQTFTIDWTPTQAGPYQVVAVANPDDSFAEVSASNNLGLITVEVVSGSGQQLAAGVDKSSYVPGDTVSGSVTTSNYDEAFTGRLVIAVEDQLGYLVTNLFSGNILSLAFDQSQVSSVSWPTGSTFAGNYQLHARLYDQNNNQVSEAKAPFAITANSQFSGQVATDKATYLANENVLATATYTYATGNAPVSGAQAWLRLVDGSNNVLAQTLQPLGDLLPGATGTVTVNWNTGASAVGGYTALFTVSQQTSTLASAQVPFVIAGGAPNLQGTVSLSDQAPAPGTAELVTYTIHNAGNAAISQLPVQVSLLDPAAPTPIATKSATVTLSVGGDATATVLFDTSALTLKTYTVQLQVSVPGASGPATLATSSFAVADRTPPVVTVQKPTPNGFIRGDASAIVFARDALSSVKSVAVSIDGGAFAAANINDAVNSLYAAPLGGLAEGTHTVVAQATDTWNNTGNSTSITFTVDNTAPVIAIQGAADGGLYNSTIVPVITVTESNPASVVQTLNGAPYVSGTPISANGKYQLVVTAIDKAGNGSVRSIQFTIDTIAPQVAITGVQDGGLYNTDVVPVITVTDILPVTNVITLNGQPFVSGTTVSPSNTYVLSVTATDTANNHTTVTLHFTIDKVAPVVTITKPTNGATLTGRTTDVQGTTKPLATVFLTVGTYQVNLAADAQGAFTFSQVPLASGANNIVAYAKDKAGNVGPTTTVHVTTGAAQLTGQVIAHQGVLVYLPGTSQTQNWWDRGYCGGRDPNSPPPPSKDRYAALYALIQATLVQQGDDYLLVRDEQDFIAALRTHRYGTVLLGELQPSSSNYYGDGEDDSSLRLSDAADDELKASIVAGAGIVWIKTSPGEDEDLLPLFGVKSNGVLSNVSQVILPNSAASTAGTWSTHGFALRLRLLGGTAVGVLSPGQLPALVISQYGDGRTALMTFDPSAFSNTQGAMSTLANVLNYAGSTSTDSFPGGIVELQWTATQLTAPIDVELKADLPAGWSFVAAPNGTISSSTTEAVWDQHVTTSSAVFSALAKVPFTKGSYAISAQLSQNQSGTKTPLAQTTFNVSLAVSRDDLSAKALNLLNAMKVPRSQQSQLQQVIWYVQSAINRSQNNVNDALYSIGQLTQAMDELSEIETAPDATAVAVAQLLEAYETLWASYPPGQTGWKHYDD